jgi:hypothetical protein
LGDVPPWQLTFAQERALGRNEDAPVFALYVARNATSPGGIRVLALL